jgi:ribose transport system substrate-binding protein
MEFKRWVALFAAITAVALIVAGCGGNGSDSSSSSSSSAGSSSGSSGSSSSSTGTELTIGLVPFSQADPGGNQIMKGVEAIAAEKGWSTSLIDAQGSPDQAIAAIQNLTQKGVDLIVTTVFPADAIAGGVLAAKAAGIPVVSVGGGLGNGIQANWNLGTKSGKELGAALVEGTEGKGNLLVLGYTPGLPCRQREAGLKEAIKGTELSESRSEVPIPGQVQASLEFTQAWLASHPESDGPAVIWGCLDEFALGAISALKQAGRTAKVYSINGSPEALEAVRAGTLTATDWTNWYGVGEEIADSAETIVENGVEGESLEKNAQTILVEKSNLDAFLKQYPEAPNWK